MNCFLQQVFAEIPSYKGRSGMVGQTAEKFLSEVIRQRRATRHYEAAPIPEQHLRQILEAGLEAPSGYNLQPWRFVVVRDPAQRQRLRQAVLGQAKVEEAPVVIVACGDPQGWSHGDLEEMLRLAADHGYGSPTEHENARVTINKFLGGVPGELGGIGPDLAVWVNRHVMIALTTMMWMAEVLGYDTAPMEGFWEDKVKELLEIPDFVRVVALLAIGHRADGSKPYAGRFAMSRVVFAEQWGKALSIKNDLPQWKKS
jgi:nitroreductase